MQALVILATVARAEQVREHDASSRGDPVHDATPWLDGSNGVLAGPHAFSQHVDGSPTLFPQPVDQAGLAVGLRGDLWLSLPTFPYVGLESAGRFTLWSLDPEPLCEAAGSACPDADTVPTRLLDLRLSLAGRYTRQGTRSAWRLGGDAGVGDGEITALFLSDGNVEVKTIAVPALEVGVRGGFEAGRASADLRVGYRFAGGAVPLGLRTSLVGRYRVVEGFWLGCALEQHEDAVHLYDQDGDTVADLHDTLVDLALLVGYRR